MRFAGKLQTWNEDRGFGFIRPVDGGQDIFVHVSALPTPRPQPDEVLTFEVALNRDGQKKAIDVRRQQVEAAGLAADVGRAAERRYRAAPRRRVSRKLLETVIGLVVLGALFGYTYRQYRRATPWEPVSSPASVRVPEIAPTARSFQCDARVHCSQMASCEEAKFFLSNCPGTKMDGDGDGRPCERGPC